MKKYKTFRIQVQAESGFKEAICRDSDKYNNIVAKVKSGDAVQIHKAVQQGDENKSFTDFILNKMSSIK